MKKCLSYLNKESNVNLAFKDIKDPQSEIYHENVIAHTDLHIPVSIKKKVINLLHMKDRLQEELNMINDEMSRFTSFKLNEITLISSIAEKVAVTQFDTGLKCPLLQKAATYKIELCRLQQIWDDSFDCSLTELDHVACQSFKNLTEAKNGIFEVDELYSEDFVENQLENAYINSDADSENDDIADGWDNECV